MLVPSDLAPLAQVRDDFDRLARLDAADSAHNDVYHEFLLRELPARIGPTLDVGCGSGRFSAQLAARRRPREAAAPVPLHTALDQAALTAVRPILMRS